MTTEPPPGLGQPALPEAVDGQRWTMDDGADEHQWEAVPQRERSMRQRSGSLQPNPSAGARRSIPQRQLHFPLAANPFSPLSQTEELDEDGDVEDDDETDDANEVVEDQAGQRQAVQQQTSQLLAPQELAAVGPQAVNNDLGSTPALVLGGNVGSGPAPRPEEGDSMASPEPQAPAQQLQTPLPAVRRSDVVAKMALNSVKGPDLRAELQRRRRHSSALRHTSRGMTKKADVISSLLSIEGATATSILQALNEHESLPHPINEEGLSKMALSSLSARELRSFIGSSSSTMSTKTLLIAHLANQYSSHAAAIDAFLNNAPDLATTADAITQAHGIGEDAPAGRTSPAAFAGPSEPPTTRDPVAAAGAADIVDPAPATAQNRRHNTTDRGHP